MDIASILERQKKKVYVGIEKIFKTLLTFVGIDPHCPAPSIDDEAGLKRADCLSEASFRVLRPCRRRAGQRVAPRDTGVFFWFVFFHVEENELIIITVLIDQIKGVSHMRKSIHSLTLAVSLMVFFWAASVFASPFETAVTKAMQTLSVTKGDPRLLLLTDAPYVTLDGQNALPYLGQAQELNGCTVGRGNLLFFQRPQSHPLRFMLFHKTSGDAVIISRTGETWSAQTLNMGAEAIARPAFWERTGDYQAGQDLFALAALANVWAQDGPYDFLKSAELHNHICPGLTSGYLIAHYILNHYPLAPGERYIVLASPVWCKEDALQVILDCTPGKKGLIVKPLSPAQLEAVTVPNPAAILLIWNGKQKTGRGVALSFDFERLRALVPEGAPKAASVLAALDHLGEPDRFVSAAAAFDLDEPLYHRLTEAGSNPYEVAGLARR